MAVLDMKKTWFTDFKSGGMSAHPSGGGTTLFGWVATGHSYQCTGVIPRALYGNSVKAYGYCGDPRDAATWMSSGGGSSYFKEFDARDIIAHPQIGDILTYTCLTSGAPYKSDHSERYDRIGHTVMWLPAKGSISQNQNTNVGCCWTSDHPQSTWWTYGSSHSKFARLRGFRWMGQIVNFDGTTTQSSTTGLRAPEKSFDRNGGLQGDDWKNMGGASAVSTGEGGSDGVVNDGSSDSATSTSYSISGSFGAIEGQNYGGRSIKEGNPNTVYQLSSFYQRNDVLNLSSVRRGEFEKMRQTMIDQTPNRERTIITSDELYQPSILKSTQRSKQDRTATQIRNKNGESS